MGDLSSEQIQLMLIFAAIGVFIIAFPLYDYYTTKKQCEQAHREWIREQEERKREWEQKRDRNREKNSQNSREKSRKGVRGIFR